MPNAFAPGPSHLSPAPLFTGAALLDAEKLDVAQALVRNAGTCAAMPRETSKWRTHEEPSTDAWCRDGRARTSDEAW